jgi:GT2 family glycosyltransferase
MKTIAVVILNWNGLEMLEKFLPSVIRHSSVPGVEVIVADNGSSDNSVAFLQTNFPEVKLILLDKNYGFAGGYNRALEFVEADYFILLNSDVEVTPDWISPLIHTLEGNEKVVACMPKIRSHVRREYFEYAGAAGGFMDKYGYAFCRGRIFDHIEIDQGQYDEPIEIFWATGACLCIESRVFKEVGGFDVRFFAHMEEIDLCWRILNAGYGIMVNPQSLVYHYGGGALPPENPYKTYLNFRNNLLMLVKNLTTRQLFTVFPVRIILDWLSIIKFLASLRFRHILAVLKAHLSFLGMLPAYMRIRKNIPKRTCHIHLAGVYRGSIVWGFFVRRKRKYSEIFK